MEALGVCVVYPDKLKGLCRLKPGGLSIALT